MQPQCIIIQPCFDCAFRIETQRFVPHQSFDDGLTLLFFHAVNLHKETFTILITELMKVISPVKIHDIWTIGECLSYLHDHAPMRPLDNPNQGRSASLNRPLLESEEYREKCLYTL